MSRNFNVFRYIDKPALLLYILLAIFGWFNIYGASVTEAQTSIFDIGFRSGMQFLWMCISLVAALAIVLLNSRIYSAVATIAYIIIILLLILTVFIAPDIKGSRSWLPLGPFSIQPAEFAKFITALMISKVMSKQTFKLEGLRSYALVCSIILLPMLIIIMQKETGSALIFLSFIFMLYREGLPSLVPLLGVLVVTLFIIVIKFSTIHIFGVEGASLGLFVGFLIILGITILITYYYTRNKKAIVWMSTISSAVTLLGLVVARFMFPYNVVYLMATICVGNAIYLLVLTISTWRRAYLFILIFLIGSMLFCLSAEYIFNNVLVDHQRIRIEVMLGMKEDPAGAGYNVNQAKIAIGSGGLLGKGYLQGTQTKLKYVPEQDTDFIFCTIGEEFGFIGSTAVIIVFMLFLLRLIYISERQQDKFVRIYGYSVFGIFAFHFIINIGMVIGLAPVIGIPLPFFSYGGSSFLSFTILLFILLRLDTFRIERTK